MGSFLKSQNQLEKEPDLNPHTQRSAPAFAKISASFTAGPPGKNTRCIESGVDKDTQPQPFESNPLPDREMTPKTSLTASPQTSA